MGDLVHKCRSCGENIRWEFLNGKPHPCNIKRINIVSNGRVYCGYESHFSTCPDAEKWRKQEQHDGVVV